MDLEFKLNPAIITPFVAQSVQCVWRGDNREGGRESNGNHGLSSQLTGCHVCIYNILETYILFKRHLNALTFLVAKERKARRRASRRTRRRRILRSLLLLFALAIEQHFSHQGYIQTASKVRGHRKAGPTLCRVEVYHSV